MTPSPRESASVLRLDGRSAIVTGVSRRMGIGFAIARRLASLGANVLAHGWSPQDAEQPWGADPAGPEGVLRAARDNLPPKAGGIERYEADLIDPGSCTQILEAASRKFGHIDILVANHARSSEQDLATLTAEELDRSWAVNVRATLLLIQGFARQHDGRAGGRVVLFTSGQHIGPMPNELPYIATKGAIQQLTTSLAAALIGQRITVNCINPGPTDTGYAPPDVHEELATKHPQRRWGQPEDVARLAAWLVSDEGAWITGQTLVSDGGFYLR
jgi:3-oxoacyl-[acyl-carrier protein] reductase